jgi:hypothetical protein
MEASAKATVGILVGSNNPDDPIGDGEPHALSRIADLGWAARNQIQVLELGFTVTGGALSTNTSTTSTTATLSFWYQKPGVVPALLATYAHADSVTVGSEITTRDGSLAFVAAYQNASDRVLPKGSRVWAGWDDSAGKLGNTGDGTDTFACYAVIDDFGARPA